MTARAAAEAAARLVRAAAPRPASPAAARPADAGSSRLSGWFAATGVVLLATVLAAAFVQARQYAILNLTVQGQDDYLALSLYQLEVEYLRLREVLRPAGAAPPPRQTLQLRYDIFVSRLSLLNTERARRLLTHSDDTTAVLRDLERFTNRADLYLGPEPRGTLSAQAAQALLDELQTLDGPIHRVLLNATHQVAERITERREQMRNHNTIGLALTVFLVAMVLVFAGLALRQMRLLEQRRLRQQALADALHDARVEAESASKAKSDFLADMSHELRTPLHGLLGMLSLVRDAPHDGRAQAWLTTADESANHLLKLLDDMLDLSKLEAGTLALAPQPVQLGPLVRDVQALLQPAAHDKGLVLQCDLGADLPERVLIDPTRVKQVLINLLSNAVKFSDTGAIVLRVRRLPAVEGEAPLLAFDVADTGIGMDGDTLSRLFQRYSRADELRARDPGGTGLGLAISRNLASLMGGAIDVHSTPGAGSVFSFRCPLVEAQPGQGAHAPPAAEPARPLQVLVAEDHPVNRLYMAALLERLGHRPILVENGLEALKAAQQQLFDLVLMDVHMPVMDGVAAARAIRSQPGPQGQVCIVALTADVFGDTRDRCLAAGAVEVVTKPLAQSALQALLDRHFGSGAAPSRTQPLAQTEAPAPPAEAPSPASAGDADAFDAPTARAPCADTARALLGPSGGAPDGPPLIDRATLGAVQDLMRDHPQANTLYATFFEQADRAAQAMRAHMRHADADALAREAHTVKGAALHLGLPALGAASARLNECAGSLPVTELALAVQRFDALVDATRALCRAEGVLPPPGPAAG